ncbi:zinc-dependent alcohol dehydrogenase family protein [Lactococcus formosensis]|jgi:NADPH:quinone reductase-like Zn-dependent oxidoreductase|uniref:enoyl-[acyl-carrier-protein] reductase n=1 Tax=Lactococcus formosensis TaxID=1281486 RepID=A0A9X4P7J3_9LACT|nr:zinc-dependent alcohol dehydrogenase family protein [Lactococcus formosensis]MCO7179820.1 zinc-dependent alcohol dehydrogenase family protein [Lactococcus formosensis]MDG6119042.1 zinc-dependent alcohol dehydrogenase family protein [Lactococcus formosensis]MDG6141937.1 zinc-dependent alcohol dehydrogenase family protein [Lactococcus formosensis]MDG6156528.1 zinc-dependent alcohol dehydrogenase family protein [Lactococcus formosensis]MDG6159141.1 zinc-dependent alcohol dehydrogenase family p
MYTSFIYESYGLPHQVLTLKERCQPSLHPQELLVKMLYAPVNPSDLIPMTGAYAHRISLPAVAGYEGVGLVVDVGSSLSRKLIGQRVLPLEGEGTWQTFVKCPASHTFVIPEGLDSISASQLYVNPLTAWLLCTEVLNLHPGQKLAVNAAGSAIGQVFAQLSRILGFDFIAITRDDKKHKLLKERGAHELRTNLINLEVDAAIDCVGGKAGTDLAACVRSGGKFQALGLLSGQQVDWAKLAKLPIDVSIFHLRHWNTKLSPEEWQKSMQTLANLVVDGHLILNQAVDIIPYDQLIEALEYSQKNKRLISFIQKTHEL